MAKKNLSLKAEESNGDKETKTLSPLDVSMKVDEIVVMGLVHHFEKLRLLQEVSLQWYAGESGGPLIPNTAELYGGINIILSEACKAFNAACVELEELHEMIRGDRPEPSTEDVIKALSGAEKRAAV